MPEPRGGAKAPAKAEEVKKTPENGGDEKVVETAKAEEQPKAPETPAGDNNGGDVNGAGEQAQGDQPKAETPKAETPKAETPKAPAKAEEDAVVETVEKKAKLYKVKFLKNHEFFVGTEKHTCKKDDVLKVEIHMANLFSQRQIAFIIE